MKLQELKDKLNSLTDEQLDYPVIVFEGEEEIGKEIDSWDESDEDYYWLDGDCYGNIDGAKEAIKEDDSITLEDFTVIKKGTFTLLITTKD